MKCCHYDCKNEATHQVYWEEDGLRKIPLHCSRVCESCIEVVKNIRPIIHLVVDDKDPQEDKPLPDLMFRKGRRGDKSDVYGWYYFKYDDAIYLPCKVDPEYKKDFDLFFILLIDTVIHEFLHGILHDFIDDYASTCLDNSMCMDFSGYIDGDIFTDCMIEEKIEGIKMEREAIETVTKKAKMGKRLSNKDYNIMSHHPIVRKKYYEAKYGK